MYELTEQGYKLNNTRLLADAYAKVIPGWVSGESTQRPFSDCMIL
jgi:hypothetical protein